MKQINYSDFKSEIIEHKGIALIAVGMSNCEPCLRIEKIFKQLETQFKKDNCKFLTMDLEQNSSLTAYYRIKNLPTILLFNRGILRDILEGDKSETEYSKIINKYLHPEEAFKNHKVIVFSTPTCPYCHMVKQYLYEKGVPFDEINVAADQTRAQEMITKSGQMGVPQLWIDQQVVIGFDKPKINKALGI